MRRFFYCKLEFEERATTHHQADEERDRQLALLSSAVVRLEAGQAQLAAALKDCLASSTADSDKDEQIRRETREAAIARLTPLRQAHAAFMREFNEEFDRAERRKQEIKARIRRMDLERRARYSGAW
jgi:uncharacterized membrane protein YccC